MMLKSLILGLILSLPFTAIELNPPEKNLTSKEVKCLADNIFYEAGNQSIEGKLAVAYVTWNRTKHQRFPNTVCGVIYQKNQFSWTTNSSYTKQHRPVKTDWRWVESLMVANNFLLYPDPTHGALFFHEKTVKPEWKYKLITRIQDHLFYKFSER